MKRRGDAGTRRRSDKEKTVAVSPRHPIATSLFHPSSFIPHPYLFFGGKGGTGKTTAACAAALSLLDHARDGEKILLFSTDPAHSLSDSLNTKIGNAEKVVARRGKACLVAREMDATAALERFKSKHGAVLAEIADRGTLLDESDIDELLDLSLPGMDEVTALFELSEIDGQSNYSRIVIDTAPSGHTYRLLKLPEVFAGWVSALDRLQEKHRYMVAQLMRSARKREDAVEVFLSDMRERIHRLRAMLYDKEKTSFTLVTIPEAMAVEETARYFDLLKSADVPVTDLIINRVEHEHGDCPYCRARARFQKPHIKRLKRDFATLRLREAPLFAQEVRGVDALRRFARAVWEGGGDAETRRHSDTAKKEATKQSYLSNKRSTTVSPRRCVAVSPRRVLLFGGKGGVGKTTAAAAAAIALAERNPDRRVLVFSTDPAHSLSDSFDEHIGELKQGVAEISNLDAMEIDPAAWFEDLKKRYRSWIDDLFRSLTEGSRWQIQFDREAMRDVVELAPPGIDEIAALSTISNLLEESRYDLIVIDTAPTGHLIRFLELPEIALSWVRTLIKLLLKYKDVVRWNEIAEELIALSKSIKRVVALLTDAGECEFVGVAIAERMSFEETLRLTESLKRLKVAMRHLLINNVVPMDAASACEFCATRLASQRRVIGDFKKSFKRKVELMIAPQQRREIRGRAALEKHFACWQSLTETR
ncbi:MAG TPA: ArsA family ATPase [Blastocatellia bacterium]|nr:ArsA family ATPase [Blastocatellia bacterium]